MKAQASSLFQSDFPHPCKKSVHWLCRCRNRFGGDPLNRHLRGRYINGRRDTAACNSEFADSPSMESRAVGSSAPGFGKAPSLVVIPWSESV